MNACIVQRLALALGTLLFPLITTASDLAPSTEWQLVFNDEFSGDHVDLTKWNLRDPWGKERNQELQAYVTNAFELRDGVLRIKAERRTVRYDGKLRHYTSGMMTTYRKFEQQFGRFEIRARVPRGNGMWPAIWLLPAPLGWPPEIDVMEVLGHETAKLYTTHHWAQDGYKQADTGITMGPDLAGDFHVFAIEWDAAKIVWTVDGKERFRSVKSIPRVPMYLLMNLAIGGHWGNPPDRTTPFPGAFEIDYVRVYQRSAQTVAR
ncbi:MAG: glycoside hydrolase family 16 protein [Verrucomicrobia bacterium]|nr:glycoside hydrolase family 16 protein [Verrucomicrobiota bacterium]